MKKHQPDPYITGETMSRTIPTYEYRPESIGAQVARLLSQFLRVNRDRKQIAEEIGVSVELIEKWASGGITVGLTSSNMKRFVETTDIDVDRLIVIDAKKCILDGLKQIDRLRESDPQFAFLLDLSPGLEKAIEFESRLHRDELLKEACEIANRIGDPLVGYQIFANSRYVSTWWEEVDRRQRPAGEILIRLIIRLYVGFEDLNTDAPTVDDVRFRVIARNTLGCDPREILGVKNLHEALEKIFATKEKWLTKGIANILGMNANVVKSLREWNAQTSTGKMTVKTIGGIIRALLRENGHEDKVSAFDRALGNYQEADSRGWAKEVVFWPKNKTTSLSCPAEIRHEEPPPTRANELPAMSKKAVTISPTQDNDKPVDGNVTLVARLEFARAIATLDILLQEFPELRNRIPDSFLPAQAPQQAKDRFDELCDNKQALDANAVEEFARVFCGLPKITRRLMQSDKEVRDTVLKRIDPSLVEMQKLLDASGSPQPEEYLSTFVHPQKRVGLLVGEHKQRKT